jgi:hypothetical protein
MGPFATLTELKDAVEFEVDDGLARLATGTLDEVSDLIRTHGLDWDTDNAPGYVKRLTIKATARFLRNPDAYTQSRAGDETLGWRDQGEEAGGAYLTRAEIEAVRRLSGSSGFASVQVIGWRTASRPNLYVPVEGGGKPFPFRPDTPSDEVYGAPVWTTPSFPTDSIPPERL